MESASQRQRRPRENLQRHAVDVHKSLAVLTVLALPILKLRAAAVTPESGFSTVRRHAGQRFQLAGLFLVCG